jgi:hypothetical protein
MKNISACALLAHLARERIWPFVVFRCLLLLARWVDG